MGAIHFEAWRSTYVRKLIKYRSQECIQRNSWLGDDPEDLVQELTIHVWRRSPQFDQNRSSYRTFVDRIVDNKIKTILIAAKAQKRDARLSLSLSKLEDPNDPESEDFINLLSSDKHRSQVYGRDLPAEYLQDMRIDLTLVRSSLPSQEQDVWDHLGESTPVTEIASILKLNRSTVYERIKVIRQRLRAGGYIPLK